MAARFRPIFIRGRRDPRERYYDARADKIVSRRQYDIARREKLTGVKGLGHERYAGYRAARGERNRMRRYNAVLDQYEKYRRQQGYKGTRGALRRERDLTEAMRILRRKDSRDTGKPGYRYSAAKTRALVMLGRISDAWLLEAGYVRGGGYSPRGGEYFTAA